MLELARRHRVNVLLASRVPGRQHEIRPALAGELAAWRNAATICESAHQHGVDLLLAKGAALAYTHYAAPHLRPRDDIDILIRRADLDRASAMLASIGYERDAEPNAELWTGQHHYCKTTPSGVVRVDVHWRAANPIAFAGALAFDDVWPRSVPVAAMGPHARTLAPADSLLLACLHRVAHHQDRVELLWLWDIHLLASRMSTGELSQFSGEAVRAKLGAVCARGLALAHECFGTVVPDCLLAELAGAKNEPSAAFVGAALSALEVARADLAALRGWRARASLVREHLVPPAMYMRQRYPRWPAALLPIAYIHRILRGAPRWLRR